MMRYMFRIVPAPPDLAPFVSVLWALDADAAPAAPAAPPERVLPDGCCELVVHAGDRFAAALPGQRAQVQPQALLHGQIEHALSLQPLGRVAMVAARFRPHGVSGLFGIPPQELMGGAVDLGALFPRAGQMLLQRVQDARDVDAQLGTLTAFLRTQRRRASSPAWMPLALAQLGRVETRVDELAATLGSSIRGLQRAFAQHVGLAPKRYQQLLRVRAGAGQLRGHAAIARIALDQGFADESHFGRAFRDVVGESPAAFRRALAQQSALVP